MLGYVLSSEAIAVVIGLAAALVAGPLFYVSAARSA
jgi:hypothetical protein